MAFLSLMELFDIVVMSLVVGFIFKDILRPQRGPADPDDLIRNVTPGKSPRLSDFWFAVLLVAPAIIFHEFGHKFTAMAFGLSATFHAAYAWLVIGVILKFVLPGFVFFVPAYVSYPLSASPSMSALIAFAGPAVNGLFWLGCFLYMRFSLPKRRLRRKDEEKLRFLVLFRRINGFLFVFNLLPIPGFDGFHLFSSLWRLVA